MKTLTDLEIDTQSDYDLDITEKEDGNDWPNYPYED